MASEPNDAGGEGVSAGAWRRVFGSLAALLSALLLIVLVWQVAVSNRERDAALARERRSYDMLIVIRGLDASMARAEAALGRFVTSSNRGTGTSYFDEWRRAGSMINRLRTLAADDPEQLRQLELLAALYRQRGEELAAPATRATYRQGWAALSLYYKAGKSPALPQIARTLDTLSAHERDRLIALTDEAERRVEQSNALTQTLSVLGVALVIVAIVLGWLGVQAIAERRVASRRADEETDRADELEARVAERTRELRLANEALLAEATERAAAEAQLRQVQKMEAVGQLTGGIAHDFNNMLAVVVGGLDLARRRLAQRPEDAGRHIDNAMDGAERAAALTRRLLAFARAEPLLPESFEPAALIAGMANLLDRTLGERVTVAVDAPPAVWPVWCDPHGMENAILNLAVNARDAMDGEGLLTIRAENIALPGGEVGEAPAGDYVRISVADRGCGIPPELIERVFEPFFTTKPVGKGTGLGLSQIFGFAHQSGGEVAIDSVVGEGTTVSIYLPRFTAAAEAPAGEAPRAGAPPAPDDAPALILVVEDDPRVRSATCEALEELGHTPLPCSNGEEALDAFARNRGIRLVITDVVMPGMTGPQLAARVTGLRPDVALLFVSGYVGEAGDADQFRGHDLLRKPFTVSQLAGAVRAALARGGTIRDEAA